MFPNQGQKQQQTQQNIVYQQQVPQQQVPQQQVPQQQQVVYQQPQQGIYQQQVPQQVQYQQQVPQQGYVQQQFVPQQQQQQFVPQQQQQQFIPQQQVQYQQIPQQVQYQQVPQQQQQVVYQQVPQQKIVYVQQQPQQQQQQQQKVVYVPQNNQGQQNVAYQQPQQGYAKPPAKKKAPPVYGQKQNVPQYKDDKKVNNIYDAADKLDDGDDEDKPWEQPRQGYQGTVEAHSKFNAAQALEDAKQLRKAMKGLGCDKKKVAAITGARSHAQRLMIKKQFLTVDQELYGKGKNRDLLKDLKSELSGNYEDLVMALYMEPGEFDARLIKDAVDGAGFNTDLLVEVLCTRTNNEIALMKNAWNKCLKEKKTMIQRVEGETKKMLGNNNFQTLILTLLKGKRPANKKVDDIAVQKDAEELNRHITQDKKKDAKSKFVELYTNRSWAHIGAISDKFQRISKKYTLPAAIKKTFGDGSDTSKALRVITHFCSEPYDYWAQKLRASMKGLGTTDSMLIRVVVTRCEIDMDNVRNIFAKRYGEGQTLKKWIESDCSGAYRDLLNAVCGYGI